MNLLVKLIERTTGRTVADILQRQAFDPLGFSQTGWKTHNDDNLIFNVHEDTDVLGPYDSARGRSKQSFYICPRIYPLGPCAFESRESEWASSVAGVSVSPLNDHAESGKLAPRLTDTRLLLVGAG